MRKNHRKPDFLIIGVQKSATTWLQECLRQHPDVFMPRNELHYFDRDDNFVKGENWYLEHFANAEANQIVGEKTPDYIWTNCVSTPGISELKHKRIHEFNPDIKLIVIFRNPVERFVSALHHNRRLGRLPAKMGVTELLKSERHAQIVNRMLERGLYAEQLKNYFEIFRREQIKILFHDHIKSDPDAVLRKVQSFLGIELKESRSDIRKRYNEYNATEFGARLIAGTDGLLRSVVISFDRYLLSRLPIAQVGYPILSVDERGYLTDYYKSEMQVFLGQVGHGLPSGWNFDLTSLSER